MKTGLSYIKQGDKVVLRDILNKLIETVDTNADLIDNGGNEFNLNHYLGDYESEYTLEKAIEMLPIEPKPGMLLRFREKESHVFQEYILDKDDWTKENNWRIISGGSIIDGGAW